MTGIYSTPEWRRFRAAVIARDAERCTVGRLLGGPCHPTLDVHHVVPVSEGGPPLDEGNVVTVCHRHHPQLEGLRRAILRKRAPRPCRHRHRYDHARRECLERRLRAA